MKTRTALFTIFITVFPFFVAGQSPWTRVTPLPVENAINDIITIPGTGKLIAVCGGSLIMRSSDAGVTWDFIYHPAGMNNNYYGKCIRFINAETGFIGGSFLTILRTTDGGNNWYLVDSTSTIYSWQCINDIEFINETTGFAVGDFTTIKKTVDGGGTWTNIEAGNDFNLSRIEFCTETTGFITGYSDEYILKTTDGGNNWQIIDYPTGLENFSIDEIQFVNETTGFVFCHPLYPASEDAICKTTDAGETWNIVYSNPSAYSGSMDFIDDQHGIIGAGTGLYSSKVILTENGGEDWTETILPGFSWFGTYSVCFPDEDNAFSVGAMGQIYKSSDGGNNWEAKYQRTFYGNIYQVQFVDQNTGFALAESHMGGMAVSDLMKTVDGGLTWNLSSGFWNYNGAFFFVNPYLGFLTFNDLGLKLKKTNNGGADWTMIETGFDFEPQAVKFYGTNTGFIIGKWQIIKTTDSGNTWQEVNYPPLYSQEFYDIELLSEEDIFIVGIDENYSATAIFKSSDGGVSWESDSLGNYWAPGDLFFLDENTAFIACENNAILKSVDGGDSWFETTLDNPYHIYFKSIFFPTQDIGYAVGDGPYETIVKTTDGGETWSVINSGTTSGLRGVYFADADNGLIFGDAGVVLKTTTGGITGFEDAKLVSHDSLLEIYPNPFSNWVTINFNRTGKRSKGQITLFDQNGKFIQNYTVNKSAEMLTISTDHLKPGIYFFQLKTYGGISETRKMVKL